MGSKKRSFSEGSEKFLGRIPPTLFNVLSPSPQLGTQLVWLQTKIKPHLHSGSLLAERLRLVHVCQGNLFLFGANECIPLKRTVKESEEGLLEALSHRLGARGKVCYSKMPFGPGIRVLPLYSDSPCLSISTMGFGGPGQCPLAHQVACMKMVRGVPNADELRRLGRS